jgi:hypothetical protein
VGVGVPVGEVESVGGDAGPTGHCCLQLAATIIILLTFS